MKILTPDQSLRIRELWRRGALGWKYRPVQKLMDVAEKSTDELLFVENCSRRLGKSFRLVGRATEVALEGKESQIRLIAPTQRQLKTIIRPLFRIIGRDAPDGIRPIWKGAESKYVFPSTGSEIGIAGANNGHEDDSRGTEADWIGVDEAGFIDNLDYLVDSVLMPQLLTVRARDNRRGRLVLKSTPPRTPAHPFRKYAEAAKLAKAYAEFDIFKSGYPKEIIDLFCKQAGGPLSTTWLREYLCQFVVDKDFAIIPEWDDKFQLEIPRDEYFGFYHVYEGMDIGVSDLTVVIFGYYDFKKAIVVIEDELWMNGPQMTTDLLAKKIAEKEATLYKDHPIFRRVSDNDNLLLIQDLGYLHNLHFLATTKDRLEAMVNEARMYVGAGRLAVHPRCEQLLGCLKFGVWDEKRKKFARSDVYGHYDALAAVIYLLRNLDITTNPVPSSFGIKQSTHQISAELLESPNAARVRQILNFPGMN